MVWEYPKADFSRHALKSKTREVLVLKSTEFWEGAWGVIWIAYALAIVLGGIGMSPLYQDALEWMSVLQYALFFGAFGTLRILGVLGESLYLRSATAGIYMVTWGGLCGYYITSPYEEWMSFVSCLFFCLSDLWIFQCLSQWEKAIRESYGSDSSARRAASQGSLSRERAGRFNVRLRDCCRWLISQAQFGFMGKERSADARSNRGARYAPVSIKKPRRRKLALTRKTAAVAVRQRSITRTLTPSITRTLTPKVRYGSSRKHRGGEFSPS